MSSSGNTERIGVYDIGAIIHREFQWIFREQFVQDYGIDAHIELTDNGKPTGQLLAVQIKSGQSYLKKTQDNAITFYVDPKHFNYWSSFSLPVLILIYDEVKKDCYWQKFDESKAEKTPKGYKIAIPLGNKLESNAKEVIKRMISPSQEKTKLNNLVVHRSFMKLLDGNNKRIIVEVQEWINKSSGRGEFKFFLDDDGEVEEIEHWPWVMFPGWNYTELFKHMFPWGDLGIDEEFYEEHEREEYQGQCGRWDSEDGCYYYTESFEDWSEGLPTIRPYANFSGEVDAYKLVLTLNDLGKAFLKVSAYLEAEEEF